MDKFLYRYEIEYSSSENRTSVYLVERKVLRETDKCYFISRYGYGSNERRVLKEAYNTYAFDTLKKAKEHFIRRLNKRISWYEYWAEECEKALKIIEGKSEDCKGHNCSCHLGAPCQACLECELCNKEDE